MVAHVFPLSQKSWLAVGRIKQNDENGNVVNGNVVAVNTKNCVIEGADKLIATVGLRDVVVVKLHGGPNARSLQ